MASLGQINKDIYDYINSPVPKLGEISIQPKPIDNQTDSPRLAEKVDFSKYSDKPFYDDAKAVAKSIGKGFAVNLPEQVGQSAQALSAEGSTVSNWGKKVVDNAKARAEDWQADMTGRGNIAKSLIQGGEMIGPSIATLPAYLAGPVAGAAATIALYGGSSYQDVYDRAKEKGLSDSEAHKAGLMEGAIEAGGELISNKLSLGLLGAGRKIGAEAITKGAVSKDVLKPFAQSFAKMAAGEQLTEGLQNYGQSKVEGAYGLSKEKGLGESFSETFGPTMGMSVLLSPFGLAGHYVSSKRAEAINNILDNPNSGTKGERLRVVNMLHADAIKTGISPEDAAEWKKEAYISIANDQPIYKGDVGTDTKLPDSNNPKQKDLLPTGEKIINKDVARVYNKFNDIYKLTDDPNDLDYKESLDSIYQSLSTIINTGEGKTVDPIKQKEAKKVLDLINASTSVKERLFNRSLEADKAEEKISDEVTEEPDSSEIAPDELKNLMDAAGYIDKQDNIAEESDIKNPTVLNQEVVDATDDDRSIDREPENILKESPRQNDIPGLDAATASTTTEVSDVLSALNQQDASPDTIAPKVPTESAGSSQVQAAQGAAVSEPVQPVVQEETKAPTVPKEPKAKITKPKASKETKEVEVLPQDSEITIIRDKVATKGNYSIPPKFTGENGEIKGRVVGPKLSKTGKVLGYYIATDYKNSNGSIETTTHLISASAIKGLNETPKERISNTVNHNEEVASDKISAEVNDSESTQDTVKDVEPRDLQKIDDLLVKLEDLRDELSITDFSDKESRSEIKSQIKELESTLSTLGYTERQKDVKFTTSEDSESVRVSEDEYALETDELENKGFIINENDEYQWDFLEDNSSVKHSPLKNNHLNNRLIFNKFMSRVSDKVKEEVDFYFIDDFEGYSKWSDSPTFRSAYSFDGRISKGLHVKNKETGRTSIFLNANINPDAFAGTFIHEVVGHFGVRKVIDIFAPNDPQGKSLLSKYDNYLVNLINSDKSMRERAISNASKWSLYLDSYIKTHSKQGESKEQLFSRIEKEWGNKVGKPFTTLPIRVNGKIVPTKVPVEVAAKWADEYIAETAKELYFDKKFIEREVGFGLSSSTLRSIKRTRLEKALKRILQRIKHYLRGIFGEYVNTVEEEDIHIMIAKSFDYIFNNIDERMFVKQAVVRPSVINRQGTPVQIESNETREDPLDTEETLPDNEIINKYIITDIPNQQEFINLSLSQFGNHNETVRSKFWEKLLQKVDGTPVLAGMKALGNMPFQKAYTYINNIYKGQIAKVEDTVKNTAKVLEGLDYATNDAIFEYMTTKGADVSSLNISDEQKKYIKEAKDAINELGRVSAELGLINPDTYEANKDAYLHTVYLKYLDQYRGSGKSASLLSYMKAKKKLNAQERAALGEIRDVRFLIAETLGVIGRDHTLISMFNTIAKSSFNNGLYWTLTNEDKIKMPWDNRKTKSIDMAYAEVDRIGFIVESSKEANQVTFNGSTTTIAQLDADRAELIRRIEAVENKALNEAHEHALKAGLTIHENPHDFIRDHYIRMPNLPRYGALRNQFVRKEIYNDLDVMTASYDLANKNSIEKFFARGGTLEKVNRLWKMSMVAMNPASWIRNIAGNFSLLDLSTSTSSTKLMGWLHEEVYNSLNKKEPSEFWNLAESYGLFGTTFSAIELQDIYAKYGDELESARASYQSRTGSAWEKAIPVMDDRLLAVGKLMSAGKNLGHRATALTSKSFALVEGAFKTVAFKDYILTWESQNQQEFPGGYKSLDETQQKVLFSKAAAHANEAIFDYSQVPSMIKTLRRIPFGAPFLTFSYKAGPASIKAMINHPVKFAKYATLPMLLTTIAMATNDWDDDDIAHFKARLPEYYRNNPGIAFLPFKDEKGRPQILPLDYLIPWSQWATSARKVYNNFVEDGGESPIGTSVRSVGTVFNEFGFLGGPTPTAIAAMLSGRDSFTGRSIITPGASADQQLMEAMLFTYNMSVPAWVSSHGWFSKMYQAFNKETNDFGEIRFTPMQAVSDITGFRTISVNEKGGFNARQKEFQFRLREISTLRSHVIKDRTLDSQSKASKLKDIAVREKMVRSQMREALSK